MIHVGFLFCIVISKKISKWHMIIKNGWLANDLWQILSKDNQPNHFSEMWPNALWVQKWGMLLWNKRSYRDLQNVIMALQPLKRNFAEFCGLFSYQALMRILILCLCNKQLMFFRNMFLKGPLGFFTMQNTFFLMQKTLYCCCYEFNVICGESPLHTWVYSAPCVVCNQRTSSKRKGHAKKNTPDIYLFHSDKVYLLNMHWSWDTTQYMSNLVVAFSNN